MSASLYRLWLVFADQTRISGAAERAHFFKNQIGTYKRRRVFARVLMIHNVGYQGGSDERRNQ